MRKMHINDIAHCWWKSALLKDINVFTNPKWPTTAYYSIAHWSFGSPPSGGSES